MGKMEKNHLIGFLKSGKYRIKVMNQLNKATFMTPKELSKELDILLSQVSRTLSRLTEKNLVQCTTPNRKKGRIYRLTSQGKTLLEIVKEKNK